MTIEENENCTTSEKRFIALAMSENDLRNLGVGNIAYVKTYDLNGKKAYILHAADGSAIDVQINENSAIKNAHYNELNLVPLH